MVESSRRVLDSYGQWSRLTTERLTTPMRRSRVGLRAQPADLSVLMARAPHSARGRKKPKVSHKMPKLDLSSITLTYGVSDSLRSAALRALDLRTLSARMPGVHRPLSREAPPLSARPSAVGLLTASTAAASAGAGGATGAQ